LFSVLFAIALTPAHAVTRAFVSQDGNDGHNCALATPCRTFAKAVTIVDPGGEVLVLDSAGYGPVTLTQSISLTAAPGVYAGITVSSGSGVTIATPGVNVVLRGLTINSQGGDAGILMTTNAAGSQLSIENCVISNFSIFDSQDFQHGVWVQTTATVRMVNTLVRDNDIGVELQSGATADISGSKFFGNSLYGIYSFDSINGTTTTAAVSDTVVIGGGLIGIYANVGSASTANARIAISRSIISNYDTGVAAASQNGIASISIRKSMVTGSSENGLAVAGASARLISFGNNTLSNNSDNIFGTLTTAAPL